MFRNRFALILIVVSIFIATLSISVRTEAGNVYWKSHIASEAFDSPSEFKGFMMDRAIFKEVDWPEISPRGYVFSVDFTYSEPNVVRVLEFNGPTLAYGTAKYRYLANTKFGSSWFEKLNLFGESGSTGHDQVFYPVTLDDMIELSSQNFAGGANWILDTVRSRKPKKNITVDWKRTAVLVLRGASQTTSRQDLKGFGLVLNDVQHTNFVRYKPLLKLFPEVASVTIPSTAFTIDRRKIFEKQIRMFLDVHDDEFFILKPADRERSVGVMLLPRADLLNLDKKTIAALRLHKTWVLQLYLPSDFSYDKKGLVRNPVGRAFYHVIFDGHRLQISPLTLYKKLSSARLRNGKDIFDPALMTFGPSEGSQEYSKEELKIIIDKLNGYMESSMGSLYQLSEHGLFGQHQLAKDVREKFENLSYAEKLAIRRTVQPYTSVLRLGGAIKSNLFKVQEEKMEIELVKSELYRSLRHCKSLLSSSTKPRSP